MVKARLDYECYIDIAKTKISLAVSASFVFLVLFSDNVWKLLAFLELYLSGGWFLFFGKPFYSLWELYTWFEYLYFLMCWLLMWMRAFLLLSEEFNSGFGSHTPLILGQAKVVRYFPNYERWETYLCCVLKLRLRDSLLIVMLQNLRCCKGCN